MIASKRANKGVRIGGDDEANNTLFVEGLSRVTSAAVLNELFSRYPGFREVRPFPER
jgi:hypothetical protein